MSDNSKVLSRNNTNFISQLNVLLEEILSKYVEKSFLKYYQYLITQFLFNIELVDSRGLLIYVGMGLGKTIIAVSAIDLLYNKYLSNKKKDVIVMLSKSLQSNFEESIEKYKQLNPDNTFGDIKVNYITLNAGNIIKELSKLENKSVNDDSIR